MIIEEVEKQRQSVVTKATEETQKRDGVFLCFITLFLLINIRAVIHKESRIIEEDAVSISSISDMLSPESGAYMIGIVKISLIKMETDELDHIVFVARGSREHVKIMILGINIFLV